MKSVEDGDVLSVQNALLVMSCESLGWFQIKENYQDSIISEA